MSASHSDHHKSHNGSHEKSHAHKSHEKPHAHKSPEKKSSSHRGHRGHQGPTGPAGPAGPTGPAGSAGGGGFMPSYAFIYSTVVQNVPLQSPILYEVNGPLVGITHPEGDAGITIEQAGVYFVLKTMSCLSPNAFALYVNGVRYPGAYFGTNATAQEIGSEIVAANAGDVLTVVNESSQAGTVILDTLGSGTIPNAGQVTANLTIFRIA